MTFWAILLITYGHPQIAGQTAIVPFPTYQACGQAIDAMDDLMLGFDREVTLQCVDTDIPSGSIRPKARPAG